LCKHGNWNFPREPFGRRNRFGTTNYLLTPTFRCGELAIRFDFSAMPCMRAMGFLIRVPIHFDYPGLNARLSLREAQFSWCAGFLSAAKREMRTFRLHFFFAPWQQLNCCHFRFICVETNHGKGRCAVAVALQATRSCVCERDRLRRFAQ
jgi:hypothetical protein